MGDGAKGTVTSLDALFPAEEASRAARRVEEAISERRGELRRLRGFAADNAALVSLVQKLPDELSHDIMVPFGGAAFFPGRLIHTNEFMVLLGEGYYAERTAKQTAEILRRRGKDLEAQIESLKATMLDLEAEAKFFNSTAAEAAEGLVEIREDYVEENQEKVSEPGSPSSKHEDSLDKPNDKDEEYARIMARLDELEKEESEAESELEKEESVAESASRDDEEEDDAGDVDAAPSDEDEDEDEVEDAVGSDEDEDVSEDDTWGNKETKSVLQKTRVQEMLDLTAAKPPADYKQVHEKAPIVETKVQSAAKAVSFNLDNEQSHGQQKPHPLPPESRYSAQRTGTSSQIQNISSAGRKAFTGSVIEHDHCLPPIQSPNITSLEQPSSSNPSKRVSRFKMQKGNR
uniref:RNA polymerase II subunit 5-mediating protein homolog n=1 Tax=Ananas comosus var. bracteatus TaxID=296719 RepID=A0A6V7QV95_ANACO